MSNPSTPFTIKTLSEQDLDDYAAVPIAFEVRSIFEVIGETLADVRLVERNVESPWTKDYDLTPDQAPRAWPQRWPLQNWTVLGAYRNQQLCGGCLVAFYAEGIELFEGRRDAAFLWDLRIHPEHRRSGLGTCLFRAAVEAASGNGCSELRIETQNINVPACRFYDKQDCRLCRFDRDVYRDFSEEVQLIWRKELQSQTRSE